MLNVTADDLALHLGVDVDEDRAMFLIEQSVEQVKQIIDPAPDAAKSVVLSSVTRAYVNPTNTSQEMVGPYQATRPGGGVYLTRAERASLRRMGGRTGAFSYNLLPDNYGQDLA